MELWPGEGIHDEHIEEIRQILTGKPVDAKLSQGFLCACLVIVLQDFWNTPLRMKYLDHKERQYILRVSIP